MREPQGPDDTPEKLEEEQRLAQEFIDTGLLPFVNGFLRIIADIGISGTSDGGRDCSERGLHRRRLLRVE